jgi:uncharacterized protein YjbI with pentapeptide repeats
MDETGNSLVTTTQRRPTMFTKILFATALAAVIASPAHADLKWNGPMLQGISLNGISLQGISLNGISLQGISLNGISLQGISLNGISLQGISLNGISLNGVKPNEIGLTVGGHQGVGLNGQVIAIEF